MVVSKDRSQAANSALASHGWLDQITTRRWLHSAEPHCVHTIPSLSTWIVRKGFSRFDSVLDKTCQARERWPHVRHDASTCRMMRLTTFCSRFTCWSMGNVCRFMMWSHCTQPRDWLSLPIRPPAFLIGTLASNLNQIRESLWSKMLKDASSDSKCYDCKTTNADKYAMWPEKYTLSWLDGSQADLIQQITNEVIGFRLYFGVTLPMIRRTRRPRPGGL